jgi:hypothetical protein
MFSVLLDYAQGNNMECPDEMLSRLFRPSQLDKFAIDSETARVAGHIYSELYLAEVRRVAGTPEVINVESLVNQAITAAKAYADGLVKRMVI